MLQGSLSPKAPPSPLGRDAASQSSPRVQGERVKNRQQPKVNTCLVFVCCYAIRFLLHFLLCFLQVVTQPSLLAALRLCYLGSQAGNDLP